MRALGKLWIAAVAALAAVACQQRTDAVEIVYIPKSTGNPYFDRISEGFEKGCEALGCKFTTVGPASSDATSQLPFLTAQIQRGVDVIAITPNSVDALNRSFDRAREQGIKVLIVNSDITGFEDRRDAAVMPVNFDRVGPGQLELMGELMGYSGKFAILSATTDAPDQNRFVGDMQKTLATDSRFAGMELVKIAYGDDEPQKSTTETEVLLSSYPDLKGILAPTAVGLASAAQVVATQGKAAQVAVTGLGSPDQLRRNVESGDVKAFQLWDPFEQGLAAAYLGYGLATGTVDFSAARSIEVPGLGTLPIRDKNIVLPREDLTTFTRENIGSFHF